MNFGIRCVAAFLTAALTVPNVFPALLTDGGNMPEDAGGLEYASTLLIEAEDEGSLPKEGEVIGSYENMYLVGFDEGTEASDVAGASENMAFSVASGPNIAGKASYEGNAFSNLENELDGVRTQRSKGYTIALVDTGAPEGMEGASMLGDDGKDRHGHATKMAEAMRQACPDAKILPIKALDDNGRGDAASIYAAIQYAIACNADVINLSFYGKASEGNAAVEQAVQDAIGRGITVVGAAGNDGADAKGYLPGGIKTVVVLGACDSAKKRLASSNYGSTVDYYMEAGSTSEAAALFSGRLTFCNGDLGKAADGLATDAGKPKDFYTPGSFDGFKAAYDTVTGENVFKYDNRTDGLEYPTGLRVRNKEVTTEITGHNFAWGVKPEPDYVTTIPADRPVLVSTRPDKRPRNGDYILMKYIKAGTFKRKQIDIHVKITTGDCSSLGHGAFLAIDNDNGPKHNISRGWTYLQMRDVRVEYSFYYSDGSGLAPVESAYFSWASLNKNEGFRVAEGSVEYYVKDGALPDVYNLPTGSSNSDYPRWEILHGGNWVANLTSNDFIDEYGSESFWKSMATVYVTDSDHRFDFYTLTNDFWFAPTFAAPGAVANDPEKFIINGDGDRVKTIKGYKGDTITFEIEQPVQIYGYHGEGMTKYLNFSFKDVLPDGLKYKSAKVMKRPEGSTSGGTDVTSHGMITLTGQTVKFKFDSSYLSSGMAYDGESYVLVIKAELEADGGDRPLINVATTKINGTEVSTNEVKVNQYHKVKTQIRHQKADGTWESYDTVETENVNDGGDYSYTWTRGDDEPATIYAVPNPKTVSETNIKQDYTFKIDVPRKSYTYTFHANKPATAGSVTGMPDNITKLAENKCGSLSSTPALRSHKFKGFFDTSAATGGNAYDSNEKMLSNKDFYARWEPIKYYVAYNANGGTNFSHEAGEYTQNKTSGTMEKSTFYFDTAGTLRANAYAREGYVFAGWNTKADGTGTAYPNSYNNVLNWTDEDKATITLYAQWTKQLGTETLTVVSEETGNPIPGVTVRLYKKVSGTWADTGTELTTNARGQVSVSGLHWFDYEWRSVSVPAGYKGMANVGFSVYPNCTAPNSLCSHTSGTRPSSGAAALSLAHTRILYMKHVSLVLDATVSEVIRGENAPAFYYHVEGRDAAGVTHAYDVMVQVDGNTLRGSNRVPDMFAGTYTVTQKPISRYVPGNAQAVKHSTVSGINGTANLLNIDNGDFGEIRFPYTIRQMGGFGSMHSRTNQLRK